MPFSSIPSELFLGRPLAQLLPVVAARLAPSIRAVWAVVVNVLGVDTSENVSSSGTCPAWSSGLSHRRHLEHQGEDGWWADLLVDCVEVSKGSQIGWQSRRGSGLTHEKLDWLGVHSQCLEELYCRLGMRL